MSAGLISSQGGGGSADVFQSITIAGTQTDWVIGATTTVILLQAGAFNLIRSIAGGVAGRWLRIIMVTGSVTLANEDVVGTASMRMRLAAGSGKNLIGPGDGLLLYYDGAVNSRWLQAGGHA